MKDRVSHACRSLRASGCAALILFAGANTARAAKAPDWAVRAAAAPPFVQEAESGGVILLDDVAVTVGVDQQVTTRRRVALRVLTAEGARGASLREIYLADSGRIKSLRGWRMQAGRSEEIDQRLIHDVAMAPNDLYNESRARVVAPRNLAPGDILVIESERIEATPFPQLEWVLQDEWPAREIRRALTLPAGWDARSITFNHPEIVPERRNQTLTWQARQVPAVPAEVAAPAVIARAARLAVTFGPASVTALDDWQSVSRWLFELSDPQAAPNPALAAKARALTESATTEIDRIRAIGRYVQRVPYVSIQTGLGRGGGYRPRPAADVLERNYGDCKDKANLMRALLESLGIRAHLVALYAGDAEYVRPEWASAQQFNHCILAIDVSPAIGGPAVIERDPYGRMLFFDPSDAATPVGELPRHEQNGLALIAATGGLPLVRLPSARPDWQTIDDRVEVTLSAAGMLEGHLRQITAGSPAGDERRTYDLAPGSYVNGLEAAFRRELPGVRITSGMIDDDERNNRFQLTLDFETAGAVQRVNGGAWLVRLPGGVRAYLPVLPAANRQSPVHLPATAPPNCLARRVRRRRMAGSRSSGSSAAIRSCGGCRCAWQSARFRRRRTTTSAPFCRPSATPSTGRC
jgi:hypothetical protein